MDCLSKAQRSEVMRKIRSDNTKPEQAVERMLRDAGLRFTKQDGSLPGRPDFVIKKYRIAVFVNGCFWHGHSCPRGKLPSSRREFWEKKISGNVRRDRRNLRKLRTLGYSTINIWQCKLSRQDLIGRRIERIVERAKATLHAH